MSIEEILSHVDHTNLKPEAGWNDIKALCDDAILYKTASVCIPPGYCRQVKDYLCGRVQICTVIGFPNGYSSTATKVFEASDALLNGADEIDMVINLGWVKDGRFDDVTKEIRALKAVCGNRVLKVIIETCLLTEEEKIRLCECVTEAKADYIKTSTGFSKGGATFEDVALMSRHVGPGVKIKAAGGIATLEDAEKFLELGADRLGTSRIVKIAKEAEREA
ncbi:MAG TPA: deoxyribose-phosphate aldolase [Lachnospiraceae bacterium]|nr:deoxyribose-phosphate aldolase [Lachnospiraceae bacterium]